MASEFLNRLDEIIIFETLDQEQIKQIVELQLDRVKRTTSGQGIVFNEITSKELVKAEGGRHR